MNPNSQPNQQNNASGSPSPGDRETFNFDQWAREVKRQMIASLKKRDYES